MNSPNELLKKKEKVDIVLGERANPKERDSILSMKMNNLVAQYDETPKTDSLLANDEFASTSSKAVIRK